MLDFLASWKSYKEFSNLPAQWREMVFYSEGHAYWVHFEQVIQHLTLNSKQPICYLTSEKNDPILKAKNECIKAFYIGDGLIRTLIFRSIQAKLFVLTMPDLEKFHLKRSVHAVHYVYIYHSLVSMHMIYRQGAFDHYDTIFCAGPHHIEEIRQTEALYSLKPKNLIPHGYGRLDSIYKSLAVEEKKTSQKTTALIAPSWGSQNIFESVGEALISILLNNNFDVIIRPHPQALKMQRSLIEGLITKFKTHSGFYFDSNIASFESLQSSDILITDWSGVAFDYAFGLEKPVLFIDVPPKINNPEYNKINLVPIESKLREQLGSLVSMEQLDSIPNQIHQLIEKKSQFLDNIRKLRKDYVYHFCESGSQGAQMLKDLLNNQKSALNSIANMDLREPAC